MQLLKTSATLRATIFPWSDSAQLPSDEDQFTVKPISTGYINHSFSFQINDRFLSAQYPREFFIKVNKNLHAKQMFDAEAFGLQSLQNIYHDFVRIPQTYATGSLPDQGGWFLSEFVVMSDTLKNRSDSQNCRFARVLAEMHRFSAEQHAQSSRCNQFGFDRNNFYCHTEQDNSWESDWCTFFLEQRFKPIVQCMKTDLSLWNDCDKNLELVLLCERLIPHIPSFFSSNIRPCLLHGDLSVYNWSVDKKEQIVLFDASPFYGPFELDIYVMPKDFIDAYFDAIGGPIEGYEMRFDLYQLLRLLRSIIDSQLDSWRPDAYQSLKTLLISCGAWTSPLVRHPCGVKTPTDKIILSDSKSKKKNAVLIYGGSFCPIHLNHLEVMNLVAETLEKPPYDYHILAGYFAPSAESWLKKKLPENYLPKIYRECLIMLATEGTRWMIERSYVSPTSISEKILKAIEDVCGPDLDLTLIHVCGIDAIDNNDKRTPCQYPLVVVDRPGYDGENLWNDYLQMTTEENRDRLIWLSPWPGQTRSSTMIRHLFTQSTEEKSTDSLENLLPLSCIQFMFVYELRKWFKSLSDG